MEAAMPGLQAEDDLRGEWSGFTPDGLHKLLMDAYGDKEQADRMAAEYELKRIVQSDENKGK